MGVCGELPLDRKEEPVLKWLRACSIVLVALASIALTARGVEAQALYGSVTGTVTDGTGAAVPGASVALKNEATCLEFTAVTDESGAYTIRNIPATPEGVALEW